MIRDSRSGSQKLERRGWVLREQPVIHGPAKTSHVATEIQVEAADPHDGYGRLRAPCCFGFPVGPFCEAPFQAKRALPTQFGDSDGRKTGGAGNWSSLIAEPTSVKMVERVLMKCHLAEASHLHDAHISRGISSVQGGRQAHMGI